MSQKHSFQAEVAQLLHLVTHSLYSNKEIFVRELVSNASDACDKLRYEALNNSALYEDAPELRVRIELDKKARTLTITDNGIGMSAQEAIDHLGTIAKSGTKDFMSKLGADKQADAKEQGQLIGQFGVGFYSGFIVADKITVESRRAGLKPEEGVRWTSGGTGDFEVEAITRAERGTSVILHLREDEANSADEYLSAWKIKQIIGKYSDHIALPIQMRKEEWKDSEEEGKPGEMVTTDEWETVNKASALWTRAKKDISKEEYESFYQGISHDYEAPLAWSHNRVEGSTEYTQLLYVPAKAPYDLWNRDKKGGLKLYVKRVFIMDEAEALLPSYLRFVKGVVDSADLPLNVSRELLQESRDVRAIRDGNTKRVLTLLENLAKHDVPAADASEEDKADAGKYSKFYAEFGTVLKEGLGEDFANRDRLAKLLRFASTTSDTASVSLADYKARMKEGQEAIYYITADTLAAAKNSPQLEVFKKKGIEVLLMTERVDEWALSYLNEFDGTPLQSVAKGAVDLGKLQDEAEKKAAEEAAEAFKPVLAKLKEALKDKAEDVRVTTRLVDSPACLVVKDGEVSNQLARLLKQAGQKAPDSKPILEVNPEHALVKKLDGSVHFHDLAHILYDQALLAEGGLPEDPAAYVKRVNALLV
ncbi:heat shock protein 90 [Hylemonella gracilis str. Niagara R]|uniref:Chaperone protein HtpG n=1 Tax=Hylemonella gracilis str. Niagara R TaxID=1458275 RepID=A0A016XL56_9BURK|nr:molecular chaperone HtpG [Hylemonella gracilis]EYC52620.1 heat shock protein 90 [Hylemonella gracilis str. Niagara R]